MMKKYKMHTGNNYHILSDYPVIAFFVSFYKAYVIKLLENISCIFDNISQGYWKIKIFIYHFNLAFFVSMIML